MGEVIDLDSVEVVEVNPRHVEEALAGRLQFRYPAKSLVLKFSQLLVSDHQEVARATGGIEDLDRRKPIEQSVELRDAVPGVCEFLLQIVEEQRPDHFHDVLKRGVVHP